MVLSKQGDTKIAASYAPGGHSSLIIVVGKSGRGKTTAIENLPVQHTFLFNVMGKDLPFMGARQYENGHMQVGADGPGIRRKMQDLSTNLDIKYIVIDDAQYIMATEFMDKAMVKGYDKFTLMARNIWDILVLAGKLRPDMKVFFLAHEEETTGGERKMKTLGKLLDDKITPEGLATVVLYADVVGTKDNREYVFTTQSDGFTNAKSPRGMFPNIIPNDLWLVAQRMEEYYNGIPLNQSTIKF
jgi:hypothetical protein